MNINFDIQPNYDSTEILFKDLSVLDIDTIVTSYKIIFYNNTDDEPVLFEYSIGDSVDIENAPSGIYIAISDFVGDSTITTLDDGVYNFTVEVSIADLSDTSDATVYTWEGVQCIYQQILQVYTQQHLDYNWTSRYKMNSNELFNIAQELTWIDSLRLASEELGRFNEFETILKHLQKYFTSTYDY